MDITFLENVYRNKDSYIKFQVKDIKFINSYNLFENSRFFAKISKVACLAHF